MEKAELIQIIQKSKDGDMEAMEKLLLHAHTSVSYQCRKMLKSEQDVEDMTQEILVTVYQKLDSLQEPAAFNQWLKKITAARCINALTRTHVEYQFAEDEEGHSILDTLEEMDEKKIPDQWLDNKETTRMIEDIVNGLPEAQRLCTLMFYYSEMSVKEMSHVLKVSENTVKSRLNYARKAIKEKVLDYEKQGIKLYGISPLPFLFYFLHKMEKENKDPVAAQVMVDEILAESSMVAAAGAVAAGSAGAAATGTAAATAAGVSGAAAATASGGFLAMLSIIPLKVVAGVTAAAITIGGIAAATTIANKEQTETPAATIVQEDQVESERNDDLIIVPEETGAEDDFVSDAEEDLPEETKGAAEKEQSASNGDTSTGSGDGNSAGTGSSDSNGSSNGGNTNMDNSSGSDSSGNNSSDSDGSDSSNVPSEPDNENPAEEKDLTEHTHQYVVSYAKEACCSEQGYTTYACSSCGDSYNDDYTDTLPHNFKVTIVEPTAYSQGYTLYECTTVCSHIYDHYNFSTACLYSYTTDYTEKLPADADSSGCTHSFVETTEINATCDNDGIQKYTCEHCGLTYTEVIPAYTEHNWKLHPSGGREPGCDYEGNDGYFCSYCRLKKPDGIIPALGHEYVATIVEPTETTMGYTEFTCNRCGDSFKDNYTDVTGASHTHNYSSVVTEPTCSENGYTTYTCECGHSYKGNEIQATGDIMESRVVPPTETESGYTEHWCIVCGMSYRTDYTDLQENGEVTVHTHRYDTPFEEYGSCTTTGRSGNACSGCGSKKYDNTILPVRGHDYQTTVVDPTETEQGYTEYTCSVCGDTFRDDYTEPSGSGLLLKITPVEEHSHSYTSSVTAATCTTGGYTTYSCTCGDTYTSDEIEALGHSYQSEVVEPTETEQGYTEYVCSLCGDTYRDGYTDMTKTE